MQCTYVPLQTHLPGYVEKADELKAKGVELIACIAVNDPFVMEAWGKAHSTEGKASLFIILWIFLWHSTNHFHPRLSFPLPD